MKNKILVIILVVLVIAIVTIGGIKFRNSDNKNKQDTSRNFILPSSTTSNVNTHGENAGIYVGVNEKENENYLFISITIDKSLSKEEQVRSLISSISSATGYVIDVNSIKVDGSNIKIDLAKTAAPFEITESYQSTGEQKYFIATDYAVAKTLLDSINKTLKSYFGNDTKVYLSADSENINIENNVMKININSTKPYDEQ